ncbi:MAG: hypothetical protein V3S18_00560 [Dehalococcoidia bacterium]
MTHRFEQEESERAAREAGGQRRSSEGPPTSSPRDRGYGGGSLGGILPPSGGFFSEITQVAGYFLRGAFRSITLPLRTGFRLGIAKGRASTRARGLDPSIGATRFDPDARRPESDQASVRRRDRDAGP